MAAIGLNVSADGRISVEVVKGFGATWIRIVAKPEFDITQYLEQCQREGIDVLLVLAQESGGDYAAYQRQYAEFVTAVQVGNEADLDSSSSWTMTQAELVSLGRTVRQIFGTDTPLVCAGMASGHPEWLDGVDLSWADAIACHPYAKDAPSETDREDLPDMDVLVREYQRFGKPVLVTEWGWWSADETRASEEVRDTMTWATQTDDCAVFFYFCTDDAMVSPFGLQDANGVDKPRAEPFRALAPSAQPVPWLPPILELPDPWQFFSAEQIASIARCPISSVTEHWPRIVEQLTHCGINDRDVQVAMIGTIAIETAHTFEPVREAFYLGADAEAYRQTLRYYPYYGRGFIQLTWRDNYDAYSGKVNDLWQAGGAIDLVSRPDDALDADVSAAVSALYFRDHGREDGVGIPEAAREGDWREVRRLVQGGDGSLDELIRIASALGVAPTPPSVVAYNRNEPAHPQEETFDCSQESLEWALWAWGRRTQDDWLEGAMISEGVMTPQFGLMDASGAGLAEFITRHYAELGYVSNNSNPVSFDDLLAEFEWPINPYPGLVGFRRWGPSGHWAGLRGADKLRRVLLLANPADGFDGIFQEMTESQFNARGSASLVRVIHSSVLGPAPTPPPPVQDPVAERIRVLAREIRERVDEWETLTGGNRS